MIANTWLIDLYLASAAGSCLIYQLEKLSDQWLQDKFWKFRAEARPCIWNFKLYYPLYTFRIPVQVAPLLLQNSKMSPVVLYGHFLESLNHCFYCNYYLWSCPIVNPAPCSTSLLRFAISSFKDWIVSRALCSLSWAASTIFHAFSISWSNKTKI